MILSLPTERPYNARYKREKNDYKTILHTTLWQPTKKNLEKIFEFLGKYQLIPKERDILNR